MLNGAQIHLMLNHIPVFGTAFGLLLLVAALALKDESWQRAALFLLLAAALGTIPVYLTGEPAEDVVKNMEGVARTDIKQHEESALYGLIAIELVGILSLAGLFLARGGRPVTPKLTGAILLIGLLALTIIARTAHLGGGIRHPEARSGFIAPA